MTPEINPTIESFLKACSQYQVLHEPSRTKKEMEHYFIAVTMLDAKDASVSQFLKAYQQKFPLLDVSVPTQKYIENHKSKFYFIFLDSLDKSDGFFLEKEKHLKQSVGNILSVRMYGLPVDLTSYIGSQTEKYFTQFKGISESIALVAKDEIKSGIEIGVKKLHEKAPIVKKKLEELKSKVIKPK